MEKKRTELAALLEMTFNKQKVLLEEVYQKDLAALKESHETALRLLKRACPNRDEGTPANNPKKKLKRIESSDDSDHDLPLTSMVHNKDNDEDLSLIHI